MSSEAGRTSLEVFEDIKNSMGLFCLKVTVGGTRVVHV